ncbi:EAL domain-containing protein [Uliginosibacterium sp. sgz301328]|uniref:EAL domain-containing protein n=1 Tax=Uliginosibacterium sp. sgz301328 TaxID=3243764 RepID=UPI00359DCAE4
MRHATRLALIAAAYSVTGLLSLQIAAPPGYVAPIFPPAGIALAAMLIYGARVWPAILVGSAIVQILAGTDAGLHGRGWMGPVFVPIAAVAASLFGTWLTHRLIRLPDPLDSQRSILRFLLLVAPATAAISTALAVPALLASGSLALSDGSFTAWSWWIGDASGIVIGVPLTFAFFGQPRHDWRPRVFSIAIPVLVASAVLAVVFVQIRNWESDRLTVQFNRDAENLANVLERRMAAQLDMLLAFERLMTVSEFVTREEWRGFAMPWLRRYPGTQNFGWAPLVTHDRRDAFEAEIRAHDRADFRITARDESGATFEAPPADQYMPLLYIEPIETNAAALGLNVLYLPATANAIAAAIESGEPRATEAIHLVQERGSQRGVVIYFPVYGDLNHDGRPDVRGVVSGVFRMADTVEAVIDPAAANIDVCLIDASAAPENRLLYGKDDCLSPAWNAHGLMTVIPVTLAGRDWRIEMRATPAYLANARTWTVWTTLAVGLCMVGMLAAFLLAVTGHTRRIEEQVAQRTTELARATERLSAQQTALMQAQRMARMGSWELTPNGTFVCSEQLRQILELPDDGTLTWEDVLDSFKGEQRLQLAKALDQARAHQAAEPFDCNRRSRDGRAQVLLCQVEGEWSGNSLIKLRGTMQDVTEAREADAHIHFLARFDALTGLPNRMHWIERTRATLASATRHEDHAAVLFLDLDHFKTVNDSLGHPTGDRLLTAVAKRLAPCLRNEDLLGRLGGDEFVILLPRLASPDDAGRVAEKLLDHLNQPLLIEQHELSASASIGIAVFPGDGTDVDTLLKNADVAMYGAKQSGRNRYQYFVPEMNERANERLRLEGALRHAIERNELTLHFQPQWDVASASVRSCEALVRWQHPQRGQMLPMLFIPLAEESGLIHPLGEWILTRACEQQVKWARTGHDLTVAVNISALQFQQADFADRVARIIGQTGIVPNRLELELTESAVMAPGDDLIARMNRVGALGVRLALDDFGTGYSSLAYLRRLPIHRLKIDRSFVQDLPGDTEDAAIASATLSLARDLGMTVVAEGVETAAQRDFLAARGCHVLQGYFISRPLTADALDDWLTRTAQNA